MKKLFTFAVLTLAAVACSKEIDEQIVVPAAEQEYASFTATGEDITKVALNFAEATNAKWEDADQLAVFDGSSKNIFSIKSGSNTGASAVFEGQVSGSATTLWAVYPADAGVALSGSDINIEVPAEQTIPTGAFADPKALVAVASADKGSSMAFKQVCGLLKISFTAANILKITISGNAICGQATVGTDGTVKSAGSAAGTITLTHADGLFPAGTYYVPVLPGTTAAGGFSISLVKGASTAARTVSKEVTFERAKGLDAGSLDKLPTTTVIRTMAELFDWNANRVAGAEENVIIAADIDMEGEPWTPKDFTGTFDGKGHKIYNINVNRNSNACFINSLTGTIKDVVFGSSDGSTYDGSSAFVQNNPADGNTWRYVGLVTRLQAGASLENVTNYAAVTVHEESISKTRVGGLVGVIAGTGTVIKSCYNYGTVSNLASTAAAASNMGGIIGRMDYTMTLENVYNYGEVICKNPKVVQVGGIVSGIQSETTMKNCFNYGKITFEVEKLSGVTYIGGIAGYTTLAEGNDAELNNCCNYGEITVSSKAGGSNLYFGGVLGYSRFTALDGCGNYANLSSDHGQVARIGGMIGTVHNATKITTGCNMGKIQFAQDPDTVVDAWQGIGGIAGFAEGATTPTIEGCLSYGNISVAFNSTGGNYARCCVGGIVGMPYRKTIIKNNENEASIVVENKNHEATQCCVGGIIGQDDGSASASDFSGNVNRGTISGVSENAYTGGLYGKIGVATSIGGDKSFGNVSGAHAGIVAGVNSSANIAVTICDAVSVNGVKRESASNESEWLCPFNTGMILPNYVAHSDSE